MAQRSAGGSTWLLLTAMALSGCATSVPDVQLRNPQTGRTVTCSGSSGSTGRWWDEMAKRTRDNCVKDLETQGYVVVK
jgi:hypothetical protein